MTRTPCTCFPAPMASMLELSRRCVIALATLLLGGQAALAQSDVITLKNGDRLTGEVKSLDRGLLRFDTDATDTISVKWEYVTELASAQNFEVTLDDGRRLFAAPSPGSSATQLRLDTIEGLVEVPMLQIVRMTPIEARLIERIDMGIDMGYSIAKANAVAQTSFGYDFAYRSELRALTLNVNTSESSSEDQPSSIRTNTSLAYRRSLEDHQWDPTGFGIHERNDELGLDRRVTLGGGMSHWFTDTSSNRISFQGGLVWTRENEADAPETENSVEAAIGLSLDWFRYDDPELDVSLQLQLFERLADTSRTRGNLDVDFRWELISDFFWGFSVYYSFNTRPTGTASSNDYGLVTTVGWTL